MIAARVRRTLRERGLVPAGSRVLVACSGGPDSAALLIALAELAPELDLTLEAASVNHGLRPSAADDVEVARAQAAAVGVPFHALTVQVARKGGSPQARAREARYAALLELAARIGAGRIAVGHTQDDQAETVLLRVLRGAGLSGLAGVKPARDDGVVRPLIDCARADVHACAVESGLPIARDPSNDDPRFERVRVRVQLMPALQALDPRCVAHLAALADEARQAQSALDARAEALLSATEAASSFLSQGAEKIDLSFLNTVPSAVRRSALRTIARARTGGRIGRSHLEQLEHALVHAGEVWLPDGWAAIGAGDGYLHFVRRGA